MASPARVFDLASVALAAEAVGRAMSRNGGRVRQDAGQFGRPIGSFQAIKHKCADMLLEVESAKSASAYAAWAAQEDPDELAVVAPLAKSYCTEAFFHCASENIQIHGGIGFTWEHDAHLYFKRQELRASSIPSTTASFSPAGSVFERSCTLTAWPGGPSSVARCDPNDQGARLCAGDEHLLVLHQSDNPIPGLQVPQGTVGESEDIRDAVVREVWEETGLAASINGYLGVAEYDMSEYGRAEVQERHVFQLEAPDQCPHRVLGPRARGLGQVGLRCGSGFPGSIWMTRACNWRRATALYWTGCAVPPPEP